MQMRFRKKLAAATLATILFAASGLWLTADVDDQYSDWSAPVKLSPTINTDLFFEQAPAISKDGLSLYFASNRPGGFGGNDIYVSQRPSVNDSWGTPQNLGPNINTSSDEGGPELSLDGHRLYFQSNRPGGYGDMDIYVSRRHNKRDDFGWRLPDDLGAGVNSSFSDTAPCIFEDDATGAITLYFTSNRPGGFGLDDIYASTLQADETFSPADLVEELSSAFQDRQPAIRRDGLEIFLGSTRPGTLGNVDLWVATRPSTSDPWSVPVNLGPTVNTSTGADASPALSFDGTELYFNLNRGAVAPFDLWVTTRTKLKEQE
jgi:Tol biopolymer transport system component